jgi:hypothetical protein
MSLNTMAQRDAVQAARERLGWLVELLDIPSALWFCNWTDLEIAESSKDQATKKKLICECSISSQSFRIWLEQHTISSRLLSKAVPESLHDLHAERIDFEDILKHFVEDVAVQILTVERSGTSSPLTEALIQEPVTAFEDRDQARFLRSKDRLRLKLQSPAWLLNFMNTDADQGDGTGGGRESEEEPEFVFRPDGDGYFIKGFGGVGHISAKGLIGLHDLFRLAQSPNSLVPMTELYSGSGSKQMAGDEHSRQPVADHPYFSEIAAKRKELKAENAEAKCELVRAEIQTELDKLNEFSLKMAGKNGEKWIVRDMNNPLTKLRSSIYGRLKRVYERMESSGLSEIARHFSGTVGSETGFYVYRPAAPCIKWDTSKK